MTRPFRKYPRGKYWKQQSEAVWKRADGNCEITGQSLVIITGRDGIGNVQTKRAWACHHLVPERVARRLAPGCNPHLLENLMAINPSIHSKATAIEAKLSKMDWLGWRTACYRLGFPLERLDAAFTALCASVKK
jgi:hypothetical protein